MSEIWLKNIGDCREAVTGNLGPRVVNVVSGSTIDQEYWQDRLLKTRQDVFRSDGETMIISSLEKTRKGNFLGSVNAWQDIKKTLEGKPLPHIMLMNMVFGLGKRLSPFTQALTNRKPAFPTPMHSETQDLYLATADIASFSAGLWMKHLETNGFNGIIIKWGDEAIIPGKKWPNGNNLYRNVDGLRFVWQTEPNEDLAREKEWVEFDSDTNQMSFQYTRQEMDNLHRRLSKRGHNRSIGVNLGSLAISYPLMDVAEEVFRDEVLDESKWVDWDPYTWIALSCQSEAEWNAEITLEDQMGKAGIRDLEARVPDFYKKIARMREIFAQRHGRQPVIGVLDFGEPFWMDWGLHLTLRRSLEVMTTDTDLGMTSRELFNLPHKRDQKGNILVRSTIPHGADIHRSLLVDTIITDTESVIHDGLVVAGRHRKLQIPHGGSALFTAANAMVFNGPNAIAFRATGDHFQLGKGDRLAHLYFSNGTLPMRTNESLLNYEGENYSSPVMGNPISFEEAARRMLLEDTRLVEKRWLDQWSNWLE